MADTASDGVKGKGEYVQVGNHFAHAYYKQLTTKPNDLHLFYKEHSVLSWGYEGKEPTSVSFGHQEIQKKFSTLDYAESLVDISVVDSQPSHDGGVMVLLMGQLTLRNQRPKKFAETFFLAAQQPSGFYVHNHIFRYVDEDILEVLVQQDQMTAEENTNEEVATPSATTTQQETPKETKDNLSNGVHSPRPSTTSQPQPLPQTPAPATEEKQVEKEVVAEQPKPVEAEKPAENQANPQPTTTSQTQAPTTSQNQPNTTSQAQPAAAPAANATTTQAKPEEKKGGSWASIAAKNRSTTEAVTEEPSAKPSLPSTTAAPAATPAAAPAASSQEGKAPRSNQPREFNQPRGGDDRRRPPNSGRGDSRGPRENNSFRGDSNNTFRGDNSTFRGGDNTFRGDNSTFRGGDKRRGRGDGPRDSPRGGRGSGRGGQGSNNINTEGGGGIRTSGTH